MYNFQKLLTLTSKISNPMKSNMTPAIRNKNGYFFLLTFTFMLAGFFIAPSNAFAQKKAPDKVLAGKIYAIELVAQGGKKEADPVPDEVSFKADKFVSKYMKLENQFNAAPYTVTVDSSNTDAIVISFEVESKNTDEELVKWSGTITGADIQGTALYTNKKGKTKKEYAFTGSIKGKKK